MIGVRRGKFDYVTDVLKQFFLILPYSIRISFYECFINMRGVKGQIIRASLLKTLAKKCGRNVRIYSNVYISHIEGLAFGDNISIHPMAYIDGAGVIEIGNNVSIAHGVSIMSTSHIYDDVNKPIREQGYLFQKTIIEDNVWIGAKATILCGNTIESGSIIAANSVVTKNVPANSIVGGCPAKIMKIRGTPSEGTL